MKIDKYLKVPDCFLEISTSCDEAFLLTIIAYWTLFNERQKRADAYHLGEYWTYNSVTKINKDYLPCTTTHKIKSALSRLKNSNFIIADDFKHPTPSRSKFYRLNFQALLKKEIEKDLLQEHFGLLPFKKLVARSHPIKKKTPPSKRRI